MRTIISDLLATAYGSMSNAIAQIRGEDRVTQAEFTAMTQAVSDTTNFFFHALAAHHTLNRPLYEATTPADEATAIEDNATPLPDLTVTLVEAASAAPTMRVRIIAPGQGSSGYYTPEVLQRAAAAYRRGTPMFWNHATPSEEAERPEGDLSNMAGILVSDGAYQDDHPAGPGIYADAFVFSDFRQRVAERAPFIGLSHRAIGAIANGQVNNIHAVRSVDFVTVPGAGGRIIQESTGSPTGLPQEPSRKEITTMTDAERIIVLQTALAQAQAAIAIREALTTATLPEAAKKRIAATLAANTPTTDTGELDQAALKETITTAITTETTYLAEVAPAPAATITGMGAAAPKTPTTPTTPIGIAAARAALGL